MEKLGNNVVAADMPVSERSDKQPEKLKETYQESVPQAEDQMLYLAAFRQHMPLIQPKVTSQRGSFVTATHAHGRQHLQRQHGERNNVQQPHEGLTSALSGAQKITRALSTEPQQAPVPQAIMDKDKSAQVMPSVIVAPAAHKPIQKSTGEAKLILDEKTSALTASAEPHKPVRGEEPHGLDVKLVGQGTEPESAGESVDTAKDTSPKLPHKIPHAVMLPAEGLTVNRLEKSAVMAKTEPAQHRWNALNTDETSGIKEGETRITRSFMRLDSTGKQAVEITFKDPLLQSMQITSSSPELRDRLALARDMPDAPHFNLKEESDQGREKHQPYPQGDEEEEA